MSDVLEGAPDAMLVSDIQGRIVVANRQAELLFGYRRQELPGTLVETLVPGHTRLAHVGANRPSRQARTNTETGIAAHQLQGRRKVGAEFPAEVRCSVVDTAGGVLVTSVIRDISEVLRETDWQRFLTEAGAALASSLDYAETLRRVAEIAVARIATWCVVDVLSGEDGTPEPLAVCHVDPSKEPLVTELRARYPFAPDARHGLPHVLRTHRSACYARIRDTWRIAAARDQRHLDLMRELDAHSTMCVPLLAHGRVLGAVTLVSSEAGRRYAPRDVELMEELARRAAIAIENARLFDDARHARDAAEQTRAEVQETNARLRAIQTVTDAALAHLPMASLLQELMARLRDLLHVETVAVLLLSDDKREFAMQAAIGLDHEVEARVRIPVNRGVAGHIAAHAGPVIIDDLAAVEVYSPLLRESGVRSLLGAQLLVEGRVLGVLHVGSFQLRRFTPDDARLLRLTADRVALAINQSRLYEAEREARERAERLAAEWQTTLGQIADGVLIADPSGHISFMNQAAKELFGKAYDLVKELPITNEGALKFQQTPFGRALVHGEVVRDAEVCIQRTDGTEVRAIGSAAPVIAEDGSKLGAVRTLHDVTAQRQLERQREEFFANASHDLRTPVATIKASIEVLLQNEVPGTSLVLHRLLTNIDHEADRMTTLVNDLLELTRLRAGVPLSLERIDLCQLASRAVDAVAQLILARNKRLEVDLPKRPLAGHVDAARLERALVNLLANAQKYGRDGGTIRFGLEFRRRQAVFSVIDDGPGIPPADHERIFERFYRAESAATRRNQGSGLGLPIARATAELHGGNLWVDSTPGGGSTFRLTVPVNPRATHADTLGGRTGA